jgi:hypothetical protein
MRATNHEESQRSSGELKLPSTCAVPNADYSNVVAKDFVVDDIGCAGNRLNVQISAACGPSHPRLIAQQAGNGSDPLNHTAGTFGTILGDVRKYLVELL